MFFCMVALRLTAQDTLLVDIGKFWPFANAADGEFGLAGISIGTLLDGVEKATVGMLEVESHCCNRFEILEEGNDGDGAVRLGFVLVP